MDWVGKKIQWTHDYDAAIQESQINEKNILLFFTGTGWCKYCNKIEKEVFNTPEFTNVCGDDYIFVKMEFNAMAEALDQNFKVRHENLMIKHDVKEFPTVVILDGNENVLLITGYRSGGGKQYAAHLHGIAAGSTAAIK